MTTKRELLDSIKSYLASLERDDQEDYDSVTCALSIFKENMDLLSIIFNTEKIKTWRDLADPSYDRFTSKLKMALDKQREYMQSIKETLVVKDDDIILKKIADCQQEIDNVKYQEKSVLIAIQPLIEKEDELKLSNEKLNSLIDRKKELEGIEEKLSGVNMAKLEQEVLDLEKLMADYENKYKPLAEKLDALKKDVEETRSAMREISRKIDVLDGADSELAIRVLESIPAWIQKIKSRKSIREEKNRNYIEALETEVLELQKVESQIKENIDKINEFVSAAMTNQEIMRIHYESNKVLGGRFSKSLIDLKNDITVMAEQIEKDLNSFDDNLKQMQKRIQDVAMQYVQIGL